VLRKANVEKVVAYLRERYPQDVPPARAKSDDPRTWASYDMAVEGWKEDVARPEPATR